VTISLLQAPSKLSTHYHAVYVTSPTNDVCRQIYAMKINSNFVANSDDNVTNVAKCIEW